MPRFPGQAPFAILHWWPTVVFQCTCTSPPPVLVIAGTLNEVQCPSCFRWWKVDQFQYDRAADSIAIALGERVETAPIVPH